MTDRVDQRALTSTAQPLQAYPNVRAAHAIPNMSPSQLPISNTAYPPIYACALVYGIESRRQPTLPPRVQMVEGWSGRIPVRLLTGPVSPPRASGGDERDSARWPLFAMTRHVYGLSPCVKDMRQRRPASIPDTAHLWPNHACSA